MWPHQGFIKLQSNFLPFALIALTNEGKHTVCLLYHPIHLCNPFQGAMNFCPEILLYISASKGPIVYIYFPLAFDITFSRGKLATLQNCRLQTSSQKSIHLLPPSFSCDKINFRSNLLTHHAFHLT